MRKGTAYSLMLLLVFGSFAPFVTAEIFSNPSADIDFSSATNDWQASSPTFDDYYSGSAESYWPILKNLENDQCDDVGSDFVVMIPPGGCSPMVVRSDLLAEQNVPVFCQLSAIRVNPFVDVSAIKSISFKGDYPEEVAGISFHPARAAISSHNTLLGSPIEENIGYVVIVLKRQPDERNLTEYIKGMLTATIKYDAQSSFGGGEGEYYLELVSDSEWDNEAVHSSFWGGKGYLRVKDVNSNSATIEVLTSKDKVHKTVTLDVGETSSSIYYPGQYCSTSLKLKLNKIDNSEDMAKIDIDRDTFWVRKESKLFDGKCEIKDIIVGDNGEGIVSIGCSGMSSFELQLRDVENSFEYGDKIYTAVSSTKVERLVDGWSYAKEGADWIWKSPAGDTGVVNATIEGSVAAKEKFYRLADEVVLNYGADTISDGKYTEESNIPKYMDLAKESVLGLVDNFPAEKKEDGTYWGEDALHEQIMLEGVVGNEIMQVELIDRFLEEYPGSARVENLRDLKLRLAKYDYGLASRNLFVNNNNYNIRVDGFVDAGSEDDSVEVRIGGSGVKKLIRGKAYDGLGEEISDFENVVPRLVVMGIDGSSAEFNYVWKDGEKNASETFSVDVGEYSNVGGIAVSVVGTNIREVAHISLIPEILDSKTEANFTFNIGVEKRTFELSPEKAQKKVDVLNESIAEWEDRLDVLGKWVKGLKRACFATSTVLMLKSMASGFSGASLARGAIMDVYEAKCRNESAVSSAELHVCYSKYSDEIESAVEDYGNAVGAVNEKVKCAKTSETVSDDFFENKVVDTGKYVENLKSCTGLSDSWSYEVGDVMIDKDDLRDASDYRAVLLKEEACKNDIDSDACKIATAEMKKALSDNAGRVEIDRLKDESSAELGTELTFTSLNPNAQSVYYKIASQNIPSSGEGIIKSGSKYAVVTDKGRNYVVVLEEDSNAIEEIYEYTGSGLELVADEGIKSNISNLANFIEKPSSGDCSDTIINPYVRYYESQNRQGFVAVVPFDIENGWYAHVDANGYTESGVANMFWVCNVGSDGVIGDGVNGGDLCARFSGGSGSDIYFTPCPSMSKSDVTKLYSKAESVIREANRDGDGINVDGQYVHKTSPLGPESAEIECTDFMSVDDCNLMFNVCDPVICPTSRCDLGGKFPVADVISTGIIGSAVLCLPNFGSPSEGGVLIPVCLSGVHAGIDSYLSILKSYKSCLEKNIETGEYVGICDEISAIYMCEFFWGQLSPVLDTLLPRFVGSMMGMSQTKGGAEYLTIQKSFDNLDKSVNYFTSNYAEGAFRAFDLKNTEEIGSTICKGFVGSSVPTSFDFINSLVEPESPTQFYAHFSEDLFSEATVPSTSHYRVYYHIYAGNDAGVQYKVYLKNPPESSYYANRQSLLVDSGYAAKGVAADESIDFTAPSGYKELCVDINGRGECGFSSVTSSFALDYVSQSYIADQADDMGITRTEDCVTTSASAWGMANVNIQDGVEESLGGEDIAMSGITRICASANPEQGVVGGNDVYCESDSSCSSGYICKGISGEIESGFGICENENGVRQVSVGRWVDVGYCDSESVRCWIDSDSVEDNLDVYMAASDMTSINEIVMDSKELEELKEGYKNVRAKLNRQKKAIELLGKTHAGMEDDEILESIKNIVIALDEVIGLEDGYVGQGTNADKAEALTMKASLYMDIVRELIKGNPELKVVGGRLETDSVAVEEDEESEQTESTEATGSTEDTSVASDGDGVVSIADGGSGVVSDNSINYLTTCHEFNWEDELNSVGLKWRTDRNNNPTAFTTELAEQAVSEGLITEEDYVQGDWFEGIGGEDYYTANLIGDSMAITIKVIDGLGFYTFGTKQRRWTHTVMGENSEESKEAWGRLSDQEKVNVIRVMYYRESGSGSIFEEWGYGEGCGESRVVQELEVSEEILLEDVNEGDIIKDKDEVEYDVIIVSDKEDENIVVISLQDVNDASTTEVIRGDADSLLEDYDGREYSIVSGSEGIENIVIEETVSYEEVSLRDMIVGNFIKDKEGYVYEIIEKENTIRRGHPDFVILHLDSVNEGPSRSNIGGDGSDLLIEYREYRYMITDEEISSDLIWNILWMEFDAYVSRESGGGVSISIDKEALRIKFESSDRGWLTFDDAEFYLNENEDGLLVDFIRILGKRKHPIEDIAEVLLVNEEVIEVAGELNEIFNGWKTAEEIKRWRLQ